MKVVFAIIISCFFIFQSISQEQPVLEWVNDYHISGVNNGLGINDHTIDQDGNSYLIGRFSGTFDFDPSANEAVFSTAPDEIDLFVAKYNSEGDYLWCFTLRDNGYDLKIVLDNQSNVYIAGVFNSTLDFDPSTNTYELSSTANTDLFLAKYDSESNFIWAKSIPCTGNSSVADMELDRSNNKLYLTGSFFETIDFDPSISSDEYTAKSSDNYDTYIAKYDLDGNYEWAHQIAKGGIGAGYYPKLVVDEESEDVYLKGHFVDTVQFDIDSIAPQTIAYGTSNDGNRDVFVVKYTATGAFSWVVRLYGEGNQDIRGLRFNDGFLYCAGGAIEEVYFSNSSTNQNIASNIYSSNPIIIKIDNGGNFIKAIEIKGIDGGFGNANDISMLSDSSIIVMGVLYKAMDFSTDSAIYEVFGDSSDLRIYLASYDTALNLKYVNVLYGTGSGHNLGSISSIKGSKSFRITGDFRGTIDLNPSEGGEYLLENNDINGKWFLAKYKESSLSLGEEQYNNQTIQLYPNPSDEVHTLHLDGFKQEDIRIEMYDIQGRKLNTVHDGVVDDAQTFEVSVAHLNAGLYLYMIVSEDFRKTIRFIKQ